MLAEVVFRGDHAGHQIHQPLRIQDDHLLELLARQQPKDQPLSSFECEWRAKESRTDLLILWKVEERTEFVEN